MSNLTRVQGFLQTLNSEIDDPQKLGPGFSREEWKKQAEALSYQLAELEKLLNSKHWDSPG